MPSIRILFCCAVLLSVTHDRWLIAQGQQTASSVPTIRVTSRLVFLDVTVLDKQGHPVVSGLTKDDFSITEDKKPQRIFSFDAPDAHRAEDDMANAELAGHSPMMIFVLDLLNSRFEDFSYIRYSVRKYLAAQPTQLDAPAELMVLGNQSLEIVQGYTRNKTDLLYALDHVPRALPYKLSAPWNGERLSQSIQALQQVALQNRHISGRKIIVWVGVGGPSMNTSDVLGAGDEVRLYVHQTTNMLVEARTSLFMIYPGLMNPDSVLRRMTLMSEFGKITENDPFVGDVSFPLFVNETGGKLYNRNDVDVEIKQSQELGSKYYTLTYRPQAGDANGKFRKIRVTLRNPNLHVLTQSGYYSPEQTPPNDPRQQASYEISEAAQSTFPFDGLTLTIAHATRHPDSRTAEFTVLLKSTNIRWQPTDDGASATDLTLAAVSLTQRRDILASKLQSVTVRSNTQDAKRLAVSSSLLTVTIRVPNQTRSVRIIVRAAEDGQIGAVEMDDKTLNAAPEAPTPEPGLLRRRRPEPTSTQPWTMRTTVRCCPRNIDLCSSICHRLPGPAVW
jgi:VWFA-related protein